MFFRDGKAALLTVVSGIMPGRLTFVFPKRNTTWAMQVFCHVMHFSFHTVEFGIISKSGLKETSGGSHIYSHHC